MKNSDNGEKRQRRNRKIKPVQNIELSEKNIKMRVILLIAAILLALLAFGYGISSCLTVESGWAVMEYNGSEKNCSSEFVFMYDLGKDAKSATAEHRELTQLYTMMTEKAYKLFNVYETFSEVNNVATVNKHVNETVKLDPILYGALKKFVDQGDRYIYIAPVYSEYESMYFGLNGSVETEQYDPYTDPETAEYFAKLSGYASSSNHITLEFLDGNQVRLNVSEEYLSYARSNDVTVFIDFMWLKNAFIIDYFADTLKSNGYSNGTLTSYDGFTRNLDSRKQLVYDYNLFDSSDRTVFVAAKMQYSRPMTIVYLKNYMMDELDIWHYYGKTDGSFITPYISKTDGLYKNSVGSMVSYASGVGCADVLLSVLPAYVSNELDTEKVNGLTENGIYSVWYTDKTLMYNENGVKLTDLFDDGTVKYTSQYAK